MSDAVEYLKNIVNANHLTELQNSILKVLEENERLKLEVEHLKLRNKQLRDEN